MQETNDVEESLNQSLDKHSKPILGGEFVSDIGSIKYSVSPKVSVGDIIHGDLLGGVKNTSIKLEFDHKFEENDVQIHVMVNGKLAACLESPQNTNNVVAVLTATKTF